MARCEECTCTESVDNISISRANESGLFSVCKNGGGDKDAFDVALNCPYLELESSTSKEFFSEENMQQCMNETFPPPFKFSRARSNLSPPLETRCCQGAVLSLLKPHKIIAASDEFLRIVGFTSDQILSRSIQALVGPKTGMVELSAAIKNTGHMQTAQINTILYTSCGRELEVTATLSPYVNVLSGSLGGCVLRIDCIRDGAGTSSPAFLLEDFGAMALGSGALSPQSAADAAARLRQRRKANSATGLENESEAQGQRARIGARVDGGGGSALLSRPLPPPFSAAALVAGAAH